MCCRTCPEDAIAASPRLLYDSQQRNKRRLLCEEEPFNCIKCGKPFSTRKMMGRIREKLSTHWMYQDESQRRRLEMCEDCRV